MSQRVAIWGREVKAWGDGGRCQVTCEHRKGAGGTSGWVQCHANEVGDVHEASRRCLAENVAE